MSDAEKLTNELVANGATREGVISIIDSYGDPIDWSGHDLTSIIGTVWDSDANSGDDPEYYIINEICRAYNVGETE